MKLNLSCLIIDEHLAYIITFILLFITVKLL